MTVFVFPYYLFAPSDGACVCLFFPVRWLEPLIHVLGRVLRGAAGCCYEAECILVTVEGRAGVGERDWWCVHVRVSRMRKKGCFELDCYSVLAGARVWARLDSFLAKPSSHPFLLQVLQVGFFTSFIYLF